MSTKKSFEEMVQENPDAFDYLDSRSGGSTYPRESLGAITPDHVKQEIERRRKAREAAKEKLLVAEQQMPVSRYLFDRD
jgi:hypothetical protein